VLIGEPALALILAEELLETEIDVRRLAHRWAEWSARDGRGLDQATRSALHHIRLHDSPPSGSHREAGAGVMVRCVPVALATDHSPANLVSGTYHVAGLTQPQEESAWSAVAVNVAIAKFLQGRRDFVPDVVEVLRSNRAPEPLVTAVRRVPLAPETDLPKTGRQAASPSVAMEVALWLAYREPSLARALRWLDESGVDDSTAAVAAALLGARDGAAAFPPGWSETIPGFERVAALAGRLVGAQ